MRDRELDLIGVNFSVKVSHGYLPSVLLFLPFYLLI